MLPMTGDLSIETAPRGSLRTVHHYDDLSDSEFLTGVGTESLLEAGHIYILDTLEAVRVPKQSIFVGIVHITIEGTTFSNK